jgi:hypothetical protein
LLELDQLEVAALIQAMEMRWWWGVDAGSSDKVAGPGRERVRRSAVEVRSKEASPLYLALHVVRDGVLPAPLQLKS